MLFFKRLKTYLNSGPAKTYKNFEFSDVLFKSQNFALNCGTVAALVFIYSKRSDDIEPIPICRFKTFESFSCFCSSRLSSLIAVSFKFNEIKELKLGHFVGLKWMKFILHNKGLKILELYG